MTVINRFTTTDRAAISFTGNTLGILGTFNPSQAVTTDVADGIGTFTTNNTALTSPGGYPSGTTQTFSLNSSSAILTALAGSTILYAELIWSGIASNALQNVSGSINNAVQLTTPLGATFNISPDSATSQSSTNIVGVASPYGRTANVTSIVSAAGVGTYTVSNVPCALGGNSSSSANTVESNYVGWTLAVIYKNPALPYRNVNLWVLFEAIAQNVTKDVTISNFGTPASGALNARLAVSTGSGDSYLSGDIMSFGPTSSTLSVLSGVNNLSSNFFASQINVSDSERATVGQLNTTGTFGNNNEPIGSKSAGGRQGWDITNINTSSAMTYNQTSAVVRFSTSADVYVPVALALQINVNSANVFPINKFVNKAFADIGDTLTYTIAFQNTGLITANNCIFIDTIPNGTSFQGNSFALNGIAIPGTTPNPPGVSIGNLNPNASLTITFNIVVTTIPSPNPILNSCGIGYKFVSASGVDPVNAFDSSNTVNTKINNVYLSMQKQVNKNYANVGDILTYTIPIIAVGNVSANNVVFIDTIPNNTSLIANSLTINGSVSGGSPNPPGISIGTIGFNKITTISFQVKVLTIPNPNPIPNSAYATYSYTVDPTIPIVKTSASNSSIVNTQVNNANLTNSVKYVSQSLGNCGDILTYTIVIQNSGNVTAQNVIFKDTIPNGTVFQNNSVTINGVTQNNAFPSTGVTVPNIASQKATTLTFQVKIQC